MSNPILKNRNILYYLLVWVLFFSAHFSILYFFFRMPLLESFLDSMLFNAAFFAIGLGLWFTVRYINVEKKSFLSLLLNHFSAAVIISSIWILFPYTFLRVASDSEDYLMFLNESLPWRYFIGLFFYAFIILVYYVIMFYAQYQEKKIREATLIIKTQESELKRLRSQINPHFIFNTLNSISSLTLMAPEKAQEMVIKLSEYLRYSLKHDAQKKVTFKEEFENVKLYMDIEKTRFGERFVFSEDIEDTCFGMLLPDMILQPLIENALKHGVYESMDSVSIQLSCTSDADYLHIILGNTFSLDGKMKKGTGTGITNIQSRLRLIYGRNDLLKISQYNDHYEVKLSLPQ